MHHIYYKLALTHRDELLRQAAVRRLVSRSAPSHETASTHTPIPRRRAARRPRRLRYAVRG
jgi:hypothetical protein